MTDKLLGRAHKDASYDHVAYGQSLTSCTGDIRARCILSNRIRADQLYTNGLFVNGQESRADCVQNSLANTSVCVDDTDTTYFTNAGIDRGIINPDGVFIFTAGIIDPLTINPLPGKVAHFEGDIDVSGVVDPTGVQFVQQTGPPGSTNVPDKGMLYAENASVGGFSNTLVFVDNNDTSHTLGDVVGPTAPIADDTLVRFDATTGKLIQGSGLILSDSNVLASAGNITLQTSAPFTTVVDGDLHVTGTTFTTNSQTVNVADNCIYMNDGYITPAAKSGCLVINYLPTSNVALVNGTFTAGVAAVSNPTVVKTNAFTFAAGDLVQISQAHSQNNDGLFEVQSDDGTLLTVRGVGTVGVSFDFVQDQFVTDATVAGEIRQVNVFVIEGSSAGALVVREGSSTTDPAIATPSPVALTLNSTGVGLSLVTAGGGVGPVFTTKGLTAGTNISIVDNGTDLIVNAIGGGGSLWQQTAGVLAPITVSTNGLLCGNRSTNVIPSNTSRSTIVGGQNNTFVSGNPGGNADCAIVAGSTNLIQSTNGATIVTDSVIAGGQNNQMTRGDCQFIGGGSGNMMISTSGGAQSRCAIIAGSTNTVEGGTTNSTILGGTSNSVSGNTTGPVVGTSGILAGNGNLIRAVNGSSNINRSVIIGGNGNQIRRGDDHIILGGTSNSIPSTAGGGSARCVIVGGTGHVVNGGAGNSTIIGGSNARIGIGHGNTWMFSHGNALTSSGSNRFIVKNTSGTFIFSNDTATTGVQLNGGSSSWASVSDVNKKENLAEVDYQDVLSKVDTMPVYHYNYVGNPTQQCCIGPIAQDWHDVSRFRCNDVTLPVMEYNEEGEEVQKVDDETLEPVFETKPAKDPLVIELMDALGVSLACIKALNAKIETLTSRVAALEAHHS